MMIIEPFGTCLLNGATEYKFFTYGRYQSHNYYIGKKYPHTSIFGKKHFHHTF